MKTFFRPNITRLGRLLRARMAVALCIGSVVLVPRRNWLGVLLFIAAALVVFEAARGWCAPRACGIKTKH